MPAIAVLPSLSYAAMIPVVVLIGISMTANMSVALVLAQEYLPSRMGLATATGLVLGISGAAGGLIVAALGLLGDAAGPSSVLYVIAALPLPVAVLASRLPQPAAAPPGNVVEPARRRRALSASPVRTPRLGPGRSGPIGLDADSRVSGRGTEKLQAGLAAARAAGLRKAGSWNERLS